MAQSPIQPHEEDTSANHAPSHEKSGAAPMKSYLERDGHQAMSLLDDWLRAERELQKLALFTQDWNRLQQKRHPGSEDGN